MNGSADPKIKQQLNDFDEKSAKQKTTDWQTDAWLMCSYSKKKERKRVMPLDQKKRKAIPMGHKRSLGRQCVYTFDLHRHSRVDVIKQKYVYKFMLIRHALLLDEKRKSFFSVMFRVILLRLSTT